MHFFTSAVRAGGICIWTKPRSSNTLSITKLMWGSSGTGPRRGLSTFASGRATPSCQGGCWQCCFSFARTSLCHNRQRTLAWSCFLIWSAGHTSSCASTDLVAMSANWLGWWSASTQVQWLQRLCHSPSSLFALAGTSCCHTAQGPRGYGQIWGRESLVWVLHFRNTGAGFHPRPAFVFCIHMCPSNLEVWQANYLAGCWQADASTLPSDVWQLAGFLGLPFVPAKSYRAPLADEQGKQGWQGPGPSQQNDHAVQAQKREGGQKKSQFVTWGPCPFGWGMVKVWIMPWCGPSHQSLEAGVCWSSTTDFHLLGPIKLWWEKHQCFSLLVKPPEQRWVLFEPTSCKGDAGRCWWGCAQSCKGQQVVKGGWISRTQVSCKCTAKLYRAEAGELQSPPWALLVAIGEGPGQSPRQGLHSLSSTLKKLELTSDVIIATNSD